MKRLLFFFLGLVLISHVPPTAVAQERVTLFLDAEMDDWLRELAKPLLKQAHLSEDEVKFRIIKGDEVNAFVTPKDELYVYTGLLARAENPEEVLSVVAHEIGHIKGQHLLKLSVSGNRFSFPAIIGGVLGVGAAIAGSGDAASALILGGQAASASQFLRFSRSHERQADNIANELLSGAGFSSQGLVTFFEKLRSDRLLYSSTPPAYLLTHPLPVERIDAMKAQMAQNHVSPAKAPDLDLRAFQRVKAKVYAFNHSPANTLRYYGKKQGEEADYARVLAYALKGDTSLSLSLLREMEQAYSPSPFNDELRGQLLLDAGELNQAVNAFEKALRGRPHLPFIRVQYAESLMAAGRYDEAIEPLIRAKQELPTWPRILHSLGISYGKMGRLGQSHLALAQEALLTNDLRTVKLHLKAAEQRLDPSDISLKKQLELLKGHLHQRESDVN